MYIAIDPGENVGVATFNDLGQDISQTEWRLNKFYSFLANTYVASRSQKTMHFHFIVEDFKLRQDMAIAQTGSNMPAAKCIGAIEQICELLGSRGTITLQPPSVLSTGLKWSNRPDMANRPRSWHCPDYIAAHAHGVFYLIENKIRKHPYFAQKNKDIQKAT